MADRLAYAVAAIQRSTLVFDNFTQMPEATASFELPAGTQIAFFIVPNNRIDAFLEDPEAFYPPKQNESGSPYRSPLFSVSAANPEGRDQVLAFSEPGLGTMFAFEDLSRAEDPAYNCGWISDEDFTDLSFLIQPPFQVNNEPVVALSPAQSELSLCSGEASLQLTVEASDPEGDPLTYTWTGPDDVLIEGAGTEVTARFSRPGDYTITCAVSDGVNTVWADATVTVSAIIPEKPRGLTCQMQEDGSVLLEWTNTGPEYDYVEITVDDGVPVSLLNDPGTYLHPGPLTLGVHRFSVVGVACGVQSEPAACTVTFQDPSFFIQLQPSSGVKGRPIEVPVTLDFDHGGLKLPGRIMGWSYAICHRPEHLMVTGARLDVDTASLNGGKGPDYVAILHGDSLGGAKNGVAVAVVVDYGQEVWLEPRNGWRDVVISYEVLHTALNCAEPDAGLSTLLRTCNKTIGDPPVECVMVRESLAVPLSAQSSAPVEIRCAEEFPFVRGAVNPSDREVDIADAIFVLDYLFAGGEPPGCMDSADINDDGIIDIADPIALLAYLFAQGPPPSDPFPAAGADPTPDGLGCREPPAGI